MIAEKKIQSKKIKKTTKLNTIKQFTKDIVTRTIFRKKLPTMLFENNARKIKLFDTFDKLQKWKFTHPSSPEIIRVLYCVAIACREGMLGRWTLRPRSSVPGAVTSFGVNSLRACLADCLHDQHCIAVEFVTSSGTCKHRDSSTPIDSTQISSSSTTDLFILSRCI